MTYGERLKALRTAKGLTQQQLAQTLGTTKQSICFIETGKNMPGTRLLLALADFFEVSLDYMFGRG